jgi:hypothetical protein
MAIGDYDNFQDGGGGRSGDWPITNSINISQKPEASLLPDPKIKQAEFTRAVLDAAKRNTNPQDACDHGNESPYVNGSKGGNGR